MSMNRGHFLRHFMLPITCYVSRVDSSLTIKKIQILSNDFSTSIKKLTISFFEKFILLLKSKK